MIYLDNAATTLHKPESVIEAVCDALRTMGNSSRGTHEASLNTARTVFGTREKLAGFFGVSGPNNVIFTQNATEALNIAIRGLVPEGSHVITTECEHNSVLRPLYLLEREKGVELSFLKADPAGNIDPEEIETLIRDNTSLIVTTHASNLTGNMVDVKRIAEIARAHGIRYVVDASQTAGSKHIDLSETGIDAVCFTGHKGMMGPQGTGGLVLREDIGIRPFKVGGTGVQSYLRTQPEDLPVRLEAGTLNGHGIAGLGAAVDFIESTGREVIDERERSLMMRFYEGVRNIPGVKVYGDYSGDRAAITALNVGDVDSGQISDILSFEYGIATRPGAHCAPLMHKALGTEAQGAVRFSFSYFNTEEEIDAAVNAVREIAERI